MRKVIQWISNERERLLYELGKVGVDPYALNMVDKAGSINIKISDLSPAQANIIKQESLAVGMDAAVSRGTVSCSVDKTDVLLMGSRYHYSKLFVKLKRQPYFLNVLADQVNDFIQEKKIFNLDLPKGTIDLYKTRLMGILNVTPDSFSDGGSYLDEANYKKRINHIQKSGTDFIDIGGESSRPGASPVNASEETARIEGAVDYSLKSGLCVSVDTYKSSVAEKMLKKGVHIINDISGFTFDPEMAEVCSDYKAAVCLMHTSDRPDKMHLNREYDNILEEIKVHLFNAVEKALKAGINEKSIILDPGFGFGKTLDDNYLVLKYLNEFKMAGFPLLIGVSRKSMVGKVTGQKPEERILGSKVLETIGITQGADIIRTHDVEESVQMLNLAEKYKGSVLHD